MRRVLIWFVISLVLLFVLPRVSALPVFPGAEGFGTETRAAYGGGVDPTVYKVTNLNAEGTGSLKECIYASGPRICIFEVSGTIVLTSDLWLTNPYITIAGQTAPSPGITIRGAGLMVQTHDVLIQHLRFRVGDGPGPNPNDRDGIDIANKNDPPYNVVVDHCSVSWAIDENMGVWYPSSNITIGWCIISEGLYNSLHPDGAHSMGLLAGPGDRVGPVKGLSIHHCILAHNADRNPLISDDTETEIINNIAYNWMYKGTKLANCGYPEDNATLSNLIGNYYKRGQNTVPTINKSIYIQNCWSDAKIYVKGNVGPGRPEDTGDEWTLVENYAGEQVKSTEPALQPSGITTQPVMEAYDLLLTNAGARPADRDSVDIRVVNDVRNGTGSIIDSQDDVGGWPDLAENYRPLTLPDNPHNDDDDDGYTNLEEWLHGMAAAVEPGGVCNDSICNLGENCSSCPEDCGCVSPQLCCDGVCSLPACFNETDCGTDPCKDYVCSNPGDCSASCSYQDITSCVNNDSCCPAGCTEQNDNDCGGPVALYHFEEGFGTNTTDSSGNGNDGTIHGATWTTDSRSGGYALDFDENDYVEIGTNNWNANQGSIELWAKVDSFGTNPQYFFGHTTTPAFANRIQIYTDDTDGWLDLGLGDSHVTATNIEDLDSGTWYHIALTWNGTNYNVFVNGTSKANGTYTGLTAINSIADIGNHGDPNQRSEAFNGTIDEIRIYNRALTPEEIKDHYNQVTGNYSEADLNNDGHVDIFDLGIIAANFGKTSGFEPGADVVPNGEIDVFDLVFVASRFT